MYNLSGNKGLGKLFPSKFSFGNRSRGKILKCPFNGGWGGKYQDSFRFLLLTGF